MTRRPAPVSGLRQSLAGHSLGRRDIAGFPSNPSGLEVHPLECVTPAYRLPAGEARIRRGDAEARDCGAAAVFLRWTRLPTSPLPLIKVNMLKRVKGLLIRF